MTDKTPLPAVPNPTPGRGYHGDPAAFASKEDQLRAEIADLTVRLEKAESDATLVNALVDLILPFAGDGGADEGAVECLTRLLAELQFLRTVPASTAPAPSEDLTTGVYVAADPTPVEGLSTVHTEADALSPDDMDTLDPPTL